MRGEHELLRKQSTRRQEEAFRQNPWRFAKSVCRCSSQIAPTFSSSDAITHFSQSFSNATSNYTTLPQWVPSVMPAPDISEGFDLSPITPGVLKSMLKRCKRRSAPGQDGIECYLYLHAITFLQLFIQRFSRGAKTVLPLGSRVRSRTLLHRGGDTGSPSNYRPITLSSVIGKLFHKIVAA